MNSRRFIRSPRWHATCAKALFERSTCETECPLRVDAVEKVLVDIGES
jgi:hypothetical protein